MKLREHPLRRQIVGEMHLRRWPPLSAPTIVVQILHMAPVEERKRGNAALALPTGWEAAISDNPQHLHGKIDDTLDFVWEQHSEANSITFFRRDASTAAMLDPQTDPALADALVWANDLPGDVIRATQILIARDDAAADELRPNLGFVESDLVSCHLGDDSVSQERARFWSDFRIGPKGFGRLLLAGNGLAQGDLSRLVQRLQELGNYRNLALLGLPMAQKNWTELDRIEANLRTLAADVSLADVSDEHLLDRAASLSISLTEISAGSSFRMSATAAYARLVEERLVELNPKRIRGHPSLSDFSQRRLLPAVRTCAAHVDRAEYLSLRAHRLVSLLRTRIETRIEDQNAQLLKSMERSAGLQLRLQQLVEGFSIVALSYYTLSLASYLLKGVKIFGWQVTSDEILAIATPFVVLAIWWMIHHLKSRALADQAEVEKVA